MMSLRSSDYPVTRSSLFSSIPSSILKDTFSTSKASSDELFHFYRKLIEGYVWKQDFETANYWADKLVTLSGGNQEDVYLKAQCLYFDGQFQRAANVIYQHNLQRTNLYFRLLAAKSLFQAGEVTKALDLLDLENSHVPPGTRIPDSEFTPSDFPDNVEGQLYLLKGKIYEAQMNTLLAIKNYRMALAKDIYCTEALNLLTQHQMLTFAEEKELIEGLAYDDCPCGDGEILRHLYRAKMKKYPVHEVRNPNGGGPLQKKLSKNADMLSSEAERAFYNCDISRAFSISTRVMEEDSYHSGILPVHIACLVELNETTELFRIAHKLMIVMSSSAISWYAVGAYYFLIGKQELARRHLNKALHVDQIFGPAWLLFGHSFAVEREHDQAMAAYFKATQLMKGCHLPMLHVGLECGLTNNPQLATKFLLDAKRIAPHDPFITHEMAVVKFQEKHWADAMVLFKEALSAVDRCSYGLYKWEPLYNNLGHCSRKLGKLEDAIFYHRKALVLCPSNASTYSAMGLVHAVAGRTEMAIESFHKALSLRRDDAFSNTMLRYVIEKMVEESTDIDLDSIYTQP